MSDDQAKTQRDLDREKAWPHAILSSFARQCEIESFADGAAYGREDGRRLELENVLAYLKFEYDSASAVDIIGMKAVLAELISRFEASRHRSSDWRDQAPKDKDHEHSA